MARRTPTLLALCALGCDGRELRVQAVAPRAPADAAQVDDSPDASLVDDAGADDADAARCEEAIDLPAASPSASALVLRYDFAGTGTTVRDRRGDADGVVLGGAALDCSGSLTLDGLDDFVDMPNGLVSGLESITVMAWITWPAGSTWERVFAFGNTDRGEGKPGRAVTSLSLTTRSYPGEKLFGMYELSGLHGYERRALSLTDEPTQVALVFDGDAQTLSVYQEGALDGTSGDTGHPLTELVDVDNWLGRSHWLADAFFRGQLHEFRLYGRALSSGEIADAFARGMDAP